MQKSVREKDNVCGRVLGQLGSGLLLSDQGQHAALWHHSHLELALLSRLMEVTPVCPIQVKDFDI